MVESGSNIKLVECKGCNKGYNSISRGVFYVSMERVENMLCIALTCNTCKATQMKRIKNTIPRNRMGTGRVICCANSIHIAKTTNNHVLLKCHRCSKARQYEREID